MKLSFNFWTNWLKTISIAFTIFGGFLALFNQTHFFDIVFNNQINPLFFGEAVQGIGLIRFQQWIYGILGATCILIGILLYFISNYAYGKKDRWARSAILTGAICWFIVDEFISLYFSVYFNAIFNVGLLAAFLMPVIFTGKYFKKEHAKS